jgi:hypothetical protein
LNFDIADIGLDSREYGKGGRPICNATLDYFQSPIRKVLLEFRNENACRHDESCSPVDWQTAWPAGR